MRRIVGRYTGAPARVEKMPAVGLGEENGVPGVVRFEGACNARFGVSISFPEAGYDFALHSGVLGEFLIDFRISLTDGYSLLHRPLGIFMLDVATEESVDVVGNVVMHPGEDCSGLVDWIVERLREFNSQCSQVAHSCSVELWPCRMLVGR